VDGKLARRRRRSEVRIDHARGRVGWWEGRRTAVRGRRRRFRREVHGERRGRKEGRSWEVSSNF